MLKDTESSRSSTHDGEDQKLELDRKISALNCKVAKRRAERWTFDEAAHELDKQRRWNSEGYDWWLTWLESRSKAGEITLLDGDAQADAINAALRADRNWRSEFSPRLPSARQASERRAGQWDYVMDANAWWLADSIAPINAAMLLSRRNPNVETVEDAETSSSDEMEPKDFRRLKNIFEGADKEPRTLKAWTAYARQRGLKIHSWITKWEAWVQEVGARQLPRPRVPGVVAEIPARKRKHYLHDLFMAEQSKCSGSNDLWARLLALAKIGSSQLIGVTEKGFQYLDVNDTQQEYSKKQLDAYMKGTNLTRQRPPKGPRKSAQVSVSRASQRKFSRARPSPML